MSIFNVLLPKIFEISNVFTNNYKDDLQAAFLCIDKLEEEFQNGKVRARDKIQRDKIDKATLESINEVENESTKSPNDKSNTDSAFTESTQRRGSKKRSKNEVEGMESPEQEKRQKRNASVKAQSIISQQVNVNLTQKLRRENSLEKGRSRRRGKEDDKENTEPLQLVQVKLEKISLPSEPMEVTSAEEDSSPEVKQEANTDNKAMPPPSAPVPKPRKAIAKEKSEDSTDEDVPSTRRATQRTTRTRKQTDTAPAQPASHRATRASSRATKQMDGEETLPTETRPKRTRAKKVAEVVNPDAEKDDQTPSVDGTASPAEKQKPRRTRKGPKAAEKVSEELAKTQSPPEVIEVKEERVSQPEAQSPILKTNIAKPKSNSENSKLQETENERSRGERIANNTHTLVTAEAFMHLNNNHESVEIVKDGTNDFEKTQNARNMHENNEDFNYRNKVDATQKQTDAPKNTDSKTASNKNYKETKATDAVHEIVGSDELDKTRVLDHASSEVAPLLDLDRTVVLPNGVYTHAPVTPKNVRALNETVVLEKNSATVLPDGYPPNITNAVVLLEKAHINPTNLTDDNSLLTDDSDVAQTPTPPRRPPMLQPTSAVKEKVQQFEELASRVTRTKTRAMAKKEEQTEDHTPPDKCNKAILSSDTLTKMNSMIFNGKTPQISSSASKPRPVASAKPHGPTSASKLSGINKAREADELRREREDARKKKEAMLEIKREQQKKKREEKMAAAAAAREAAERERRAAVLAAARGRLEKQAHADLGKQERLKEVERKKQETARKIAETEERRKAEEQARQQRLAEEQKRAEAARKKQIEQAEVLKKEEAIMQKEYERKQKEFLEKQKRKQRLESDKISSPLKMASPQTPIEPAYMLDGFQYLKSDEEDNSDEYESKSNIPTPVWSDAKNRRRQLGVQARVDSLLVDRLFSARAHTPDLRAIFPSIERARLKRTSSAVWRTSPLRLPVLQE